MGIQRFNMTSTRGYAWMKFASQGDYVSFADHEQVVAELDLAQKEWMRLTSQQEKELTRLRAELAAKSKDAERYQWLRQLDNAFDYTSLARTWRAAHTPGQLDETIDAAMGEGNGR